DINFSNIIINQSNLFTSSYTVPNDTPLTNSSTYYWRVRAYNSYGYSSWSLTNSTATFISLPDYRDHLMCEWDADVGVSSSTSGGVVRWLSDSSLSAIQNSGSLMPSF